MLRLEVHRKGLDSKREDIAHALVEMRADTMQERTQCPITYLALLNNNMDRCRWLVVDDEEGAGAMFDNAG